MTSLMFLCRALEYITNVLRAANFDLVRYSYRLLDTFTLPYVKMFVLGALSDREQAVLMDPIDHERCRYPYCIVWTPIPVLTWIFPFLGHMGICTSNGVIRDFAGPYFVSEDLMAFGNPTKYWQLSPKKALNGQAGWDTAVAEASEIYKKRMHIIFYDNCHSHVATALNIMNYGGCKNWNMVKLAFYMIPYSKYVSFGSFLKTWLPFLIIATFICILAAKI